MNKIFGIIIILLVAIGIGMIAKYYYTHPCLESHTETQYQQPLSIVAGGSKYGGGIAIPLGNIRPVQVKVCDRR